MFSSQLNRYLRDLTPEQFMNLICWLWVNRLVPSRPKIKRWRKLNDLKRID